MPTVIVETDDLEALLFATSGIKDLEAALDQRRRNPLVKSGMGKLEGAHDRLSTAWRRAKREEDWPMRVVTEAEIAELRAMFAAPCGGIHAFVILPDYPMHFAQDLLLVEAGPVWQGYRIEWPAPAEPEFVINHPFALMYGVRLTHYGKQVLGVDEAALVRPGNRIGSAPLAIVGR
jgi:hypothetical protein